MLVCCLKCWPPRVGTGLIRDFARRPFDTPRGWALIVAGNPVGSLFAAFVPAVSVVSFPPLLDRDGGPTAAVLTPARAVLATPRPIGL